MSDYGNQPTQPINYQPPTYTPAPPPKKRRRMWVALAITIPAVLLVCVIGSVFMLAGAADEAVDSTKAKVTHQPELLQTPPPSAQPAEANDAPADVKVGQTLTVTSDDQDLEVRYTVTKVEQKTKDRYGFKPEHGVYLLAHLSVQVVKGETYVCSCDLAFITKSGKVFEEGYAEVKGRPLFESADVRSGQNLDGWVVFDVPKPVAGGKIQLTSENFFTDNAYGYWQL